MHLSEIVEVSSAVSSGSCPLTIVRTLGQYAFIICHAGQIAGVSDGRTVFRCINPCRKSGYSRFENEDRFSYGFSFCCS